GKLPGPQGRYKVLLILQVLGLRRGAVRIIREVDERLVVELEQRPRLPGERVVPTTRIPRPWDPFLGQPIPDRRKRLVRYEALGRHRGRVRRVDAERGVHGVAVRRHEPVPDQGATRVERSEEHTSELQSR